MIEKLLHTPEGVRDIYNDECEAKILVQNNLHQIMKLHGFKDIQTPTFEFFDIFSEERGTVPSKDMYKFFDREGNPLALRPDITPSIARCVAKYYKEETMPLRLCYMGSTFINNSSYQGKLKESTQIGAELINDSSLEADAEMLVITIECLLKAGLKEFQVEIGDAEFFLGLMEEAGFNQEEETQLRSLIEQKNIFGVEEILSSKEIGADLKNVFLSLPSLFGNLDKLAQGKAMTQNVRALNAIKRLEDLYQILSLYGFEKYITFDLGMLSKYNYYTGIIFRAFTYGTGDTIVNGGRYDNLVGQFGKKASAIGLAIMADQLLIALARQKITPEGMDVNTLILYHKDLIENAITLTRHFREQGMNIELLCKKDEIEIKDYIAYAKRMGTGGILYFKASNRIEVIDIATGSSTEAAFEDFLKT
ncbi:MAG: ATP phosphoribosyltransferase regulatory subunit [Anaerocolumna sp.]